MNEWMNELLILKLEFYGEKGSILNCLKSYLHNGKQEIVCSLSFHLIFYRTGKWLDVGFLRDLFQAHYCSTCILMIFHAS